MVFTKGNTYGGRPKGSKNKWTQYKDKLLKELSRRDIRGLSTEDLLKAYVALSPKDHSLKVIPDITYVSNVPRPEDTLEDKKEGSHELEDKRVSKEVGLQNKVGVDSDSSPPKDLEGNDLSEQKGTLPGEVVGEIVDTEE